MPYLSSNRLFLHTDYMQNTTSKTPVNEIGYPDVESGLIGE